MARHPFLNHLKQHLTIARKAAQDGCTADDVREELYQRRRKSDVSRRNFLTAVGIGMSSAGLGLLSGRDAMAGKPRPGPGPRIAIVGGGLAGLSAALTLKDAGYSATVYEASASNIGGRTISDKGTAQNFRTGETCGTCHGARTATPVLWNDDQVTDIFGELIDTGHTRMIAMAQRFGIPLIDSLAAEPAGSTETYHFFGSYYPKAQADADYAALYDVIAKDLRAAGYPTTWNNSKPGGLLLDNMSIYEWIETRIPGGHLNPLGALLDVAYVIEFGAETTQQSALNLLYLLGYGSRNVLSVYGESDERYRVAGGIERIPQAIATQLGWDATIKFGHWMESIAMNADGTYSLSFARSGAGRVQVVADVVLLAQPFAVLKDLDYSRAGFDALKNQCIQEGGRGVNGKLNLQFSERYWNRQGPWGISNGTAYSDVGFQLAWEATRGHPGPRAILVKFTGGSGTLSLQQRHPYGNISRTGIEQDALQYLAELEQVFPGITPYWNGKAAGSLAHLDYRFNCSYPYYRVGQYHTLAGYEPVPQGNVFFAGDHCNVDYQGWMEGAVRSGESAGAAIISRIRGI